MMNWEFDTFYVLTDPSNYPKKKNKERKHEIIKNQIDKLNQVIVPSQKEKKNEHIKSVL